MLSGMPLFGVSRRPGVCLKQRKMCIRDSRNADYYDLSPVGRYKLNQRLNKSEHTDLRTLADDDIIDAIKVLVQLKDLSLIHI